MTKTTQQMRMGSREWTLLLLLSAIWGSSFFFYKILVAELPPLTVVLGRVGIAAIALNIILVLRRDPLRASLTQWRDFTFLGLLNNVIPFTLIAWGETRISSGLASVLNATTPIFAVLTAHLLTHNEKLNWGKSVGVLFGLFGVVVLVGPAALTAKSDLAGEIACLLAALIYGLGGIYGRRFRALPALKVATGQITAGTLILLPFSAWLDKPWLLAPPSAAAWGALLCIALLCTALAYLLFFRILAVAGVTNLVLVTFLLPVSAVALGHFALGEHLPSQTFFALLLIGAGLAAIDGRLAEWIRRS